MQKEKLKSFCCVVYNFTNYEFFELVISRREKSVRKEIINNN